MKNLHLINKRDGARLLNLEFDKVAKQYRTGNWKFEMEEAQSLVGGKIFLHETKVQKSTVGGTVVSVEPSPEEDRVIFTFMSESEGKTKEWAGQDHGMAWNSGIIDA